MGRLLILFISLGSLLFGTTIYVVGRPTTINAFHWFETMGLKNVAYMVRSWGQPVASHWPNWFLWSLPAGLWTLAGCLVMRSIWWRNRDPYGLAWLMTIPFAGIASEMGQLWIVPGTFDSIDLVAYIIAGTGSIPLATLAEDLS